MQHILQITKNLPLHSEPSNSANVPTLSTTQTSSTAQLLTPENSLKLWQIMGEIYGSQWFNEYGDEPNTSWIVEIERLTLAELARGIEQCKRSRSPFVPRLPQFLGYCDDGLTQEQRAFNARCKESELLLRLPRPEPNPEIRKAAILEMKKLLRGGANATVESV